jgi:DNA-binding NtrC family response regulator
MVRPCFLVIDREHPSSISTRKLVIETAKFNVITAYSGKEGIETLDAFPNVAGIIMDAAIVDIACCDLVAAFKKERPQLPIIVIIGPTSHQCAGADHLLPSFDPAKLLELLKSLVPSAVEAIERQNQKLSAEESK